MSVECPVCYQVYDNWCKEMGDKLLITVARGDGSAVTIPVVPCNDCYTAVLEVLSNLIDGVKNA